MRWVVPLQGNMREFSLPNILQLVKMSNKSGALTLQRGDEWGRMYFREGVVCYAFSVPQHLPLGARLVEAGAVTPQQVKDALAAQRSSGEELRIGAILLRSGQIDQGALKQAVGEQVQDAIFQFFLWADGEFHFDGDEQVPDEDIVVEMNVEDVIMEGCRRLDEWELILGQLGSLERVPHLSYSERVESWGEIRLSPQEWRVLVRIDGHADISTILHDCGLDRFHGVKVIRSLHRSGLITVGEPKLSGSAAQVSVAVRGPIDIYNEVFLTTLTDADLVKQMRVEIVDGREVEIPVVAGSCEARGVGDGSPPGEVIVFTAPAAAPPGAWLRLARESSAAVVLANANDRDSLRASRADIEFVRSLDGVPLVVAAYVSVAGEELDPRQVSRVLGIAASVPVLPCHLRDRESVLEVVEAALRLARA